MRDLSLANKIAVFKTLVISKNSSSCISENNSKFNSQELSKIQKKLYGKLAILKQNMTLSVKIMKMEVSKMLASCTK